MRKARAIPLGSRDANELRDCGTVSGQNLVVDREAECYRAWRVRRMNVGFTEAVAAHPKRCAPIPRDQWPLAVRVVARLKQDGEKGVGDTLQRLIAGVGGEQFKALAEAVGIDCGCKRRQQTLNLRYPYA